MNVENRFFMIDTNKSISLLLFSPTDLSLESYFFKDNVIYPKFIFFYTLVCRKNIFVCYTFMSGLKSHGKNIGLCDIDS